MAAMAVLVSCGRTIEPNPSVTQGETGLECIGVLAPKTLAEVHNDLTIGCETLDRDYADYRSDPPDRRPEIPGFRNGPHRHS